jgi:uncharacterized protein (DUF4415 family)
MPRKDKTAVAPLPARTRGRPASGKVRVTMRMDPEVVAHFKADGPGWQARMNAVLKAYANG